MSLPAASSQKCNERSAFSGLSCYFAPHLAHNPLLENEHVRYRWSCDTFRARFAVSDAGGGRCEVRESGTEFGWF
jgi:hypothetical protein